MHDLRYTNRGSVDTLQTLLSQPALWTGERHKQYPEHPLWVDVAITGWQEAKKQVIFTFLGAAGVGSIMYQRHPLYPFLLEIKNLSLVPDGRGRHVAASLLRLAELEGPKEFPGVHTIIADTKAANNGLIRLVEQNGYTIGTPEILVTNFANSGLPDVVVTKSLLRASALRDV